MILTDLISVSQFIVATVLTLLTIVFFVKMRVFKSIIDPSVMTIYQICFTFFLLVLMGYLSYGEILSFIGMIGIVLYAKDKKLGNKILFTTEQWLSFAKLFFIISILLNIYLVLHKGFIWDQESLEVAKTTFYQGFGIFKRLNEVGIILFGLTSIYLYHDKKKSSFVYLVYTIYLISTIGSKAGLLQLMLLYGAYLHFHKKKIRLLYVFIVIPILIGSSLILFYLIYGQDFINAFVYRILSYADGPVYFYASNLKGVISYPISYCFDQLSTVVGLSKGLNYEPIGFLINQYQLNFYSETFGPNPQLFVDSLVIFGNFYFTYYFILAIIFIVSRNIAKTPFSLSFLLVFANPLFIDMPYAFSNIPILILVFLSMSVYVTVKHILKTITQKNLKPGIA